MNWEQRCYLVIADSVPGMPPLIHTVKFPQWEAFRALEQILAAMPAKLTTNLRVIPAYLHYTDAPDAGEATEA